MTGIVRGNARNDAPQAGSRPQAHAVVGVMGRFAGVGHARFRECLVGRQPQQVRRLNQL